MTKTLPTGLELNEKLFPHFFKENGYKTYVTYDMLNSILAMGTRPIHRNHVVLTLFMVFMDVKLIILNTRLS